MKKLSLIAVLALFAACTPEQAQCHVGADCASGMCRNDGTCVAVEQDSGSSTEDAGAANDAGNTSDAGEHTVDAGFDGGSNGFCVPTYDGVITAAELPLRAGLRGTFRVATNVDVNTAGSTLADGGRSWSYEGSYSGDADALWETKPVAGQWFADDFPDAGYVTQLASSSDLLGVFQSTPDALLLVGVVSPTNSGLYTNLKYDPPAKVFSLPLSSGKSWQSSSTVSGIYGGYASYYTEDYSSSVDARGEAKTPFASFPVLRVRTQLTRTVGGFPTTTKSLAFVTECFGSVANLSSDPGETQAEFTHAAEVRRLAP
ncbi:MAG: hypothetical protein ACJ790_09915 [Myxococcaceae bacterium]